jgi:DNA (cytosine-5)-methyltransferase 1
LISPIPYQHGSLLFPGEIIVDNFAGGGGASHGIESGSGQVVEIAINHDADAIAMHQANHPYTLHLCEDVFHVDPVKVCTGHPVGLAWFSPDCKHFSKAKGGKPVSKKIRGLAWVVIRWAKQVAPRIIMLENVEEFQTWGPLGPDNRPCPVQKGATFKKWVGLLRGMGYVVEWRELRASDYGTPTIRKRLYLVARRDGAPIVWRKPTHGDPKKKGFAESGLLPWHTAAECIDWSIPCPSIFERARPLAEATQRRIAAGIKRYVLDAADPFIVEYHTTKPGSQERVKPTDGPLPTQTTENRFALAVPTLVSTNHGESGGIRANAIDTPTRTLCKTGSEALVSATLIRTGYGEREGQAPRVPGIDKPHGTVVASGKSAVVTAHLLSHQHGQSVGSDMNEPNRTAMGVNHAALVTAFMAQHNSGKDGDVRQGRDIDAPISSITARGTQQNVVAAHITKFSENSVGTNPDAPLHTAMAGAPRHGLVGAHMTKLYGTCKDGVPLDKPAPAATAGGNHAGLVSALMIKYYGEGGQWQDCREPAHTIPTKDRMGLITVNIKGEPYVITDIGMRMLTPRELARAQGFPDDYILTGTKTNQVARIGNSVCPMMAHMLVQDNLLSGRARA